MQTTLIKNGRIVDGTGAPRFRGHLLLAGDRIEAVVRAPQEVPGADVVLDVGGACVAPGFVDMHSHSDWVLPDPDHHELLSVLLEQGITTVVAGNCGISPAPVRPRAVRYLEALAAIAIDRPLDYGWRSMAEYLERLERARPVLNVAELVGHASIRFAEAETRRGAMAPEELGRCLDAAARALDEGACGLSLGLGYSPGMYSPLDELEAFCAVAAARRKPVTVHLKALSWLSPCYPPTDLRPHNLRALREMLDVARRTRVRMQLSHFIFVGRRSWSTADRCLGLVEQARREGLDVMVDAFPYTCGNTTINVALPYWFLARLPEAYHSRAARLRLGVELEIGFRAVGFGWADFRVMDAGVPGWERLDGLTLPEVAAGWSVPPLEALLRLSEQSRGAALILYDTYSGEPGNERALERVLTRPYCLFETDAVVKRRGHPNPAALGAFPRLLGELWQRRRRLPLEEVVRRSTGASAARFGLEDRGVLAPGKAADVVVFDPDEVRDDPGAGARPAGRPRGIEHVFVNGEATVRQGRYVPGARPGRVLRA